MTTKEIQRTVCIHELKRFNFVCENITGIETIHEYDVCSLSKSGIITEFEVKVSRSDFLADKRKEKFTYYSDGKTFYRYAPNKFFYVCMPFLIKLDEIPDYAGLIYINTEEETPEVNIVKDAKYIHRDKSNSEKMKNKMLRLHTERTYLGCSFVTHRSREIKKRILEK